MAEDKDKLKPHIIYADGTFSIFGDVRKIEVEEKETIRYYYEFHLRPTLKARLKWDIKDKDENFVNTGPWQGFYKMKYPVDYCIPLDFSPNSAVWFLFCDYKGTFMDPFKQEIRNKIDQLNLLRKEVKGLRAMNASLGFEFIKLAKNSMEYMKKYGRNMKGLLDEVGAPILANQGPTQDGTK